MVVSHPRRGRRIKHRPVAQPLPAKRAPARSVAKVQWLCSRFTFTKSRHRGSQGHAETDEKPRVAAGPSLKQAYKCVSPVYVLSRNNGALMQPLLTVLIMGTITRGRGGETIENSDPQMISQPVTPEQLRKQTLQMQRSHPHTILQAARRAFRTVLVHSKVSSYSDTRPCMSYFLQCAFNVPLQKASSAKSVGELWLGEVAKLVI